MSKTKIITSAVSMDKVQHSIKFAITTEDGWEVVKPTQIDSSIITVSVVMVSGGEFDQNKTDALLMAINEKLAEIEI